MLKLLAYALLVCLLAGLVLAAAKPASDDVIVDQVKLRLSTDPIVKGGGLGVDAKAGVVTLTGVVATAKQKDRAGKVAGKVKGVKRVDNNITVSSSLGNEKCSGPYASWGRRYRTANRRFRYLPGLGMAESACPTFSVRLSGERCMLAAVASSPRILPKLRSPCWPADRASPGRSGTGPGTGT